MEITHGRAGLKPGKNWRGYKTVRNEFKIEPSGDLIQLAGSFNDRMSYSIYQRIIGRFSGVSRDRIRLLY